MSDRLTECHRCGLADPGHIVPGIGPVPATLMIVGEAPGLDERERGQPFVGRAGKLLDQVLASAGIERRRCYVTNVCKCRPPGNRTPLPEEVAACRPFLEEELEAVQPSVVLALGATAGRALVSPEFRVSRDRGRWYKTGLCGPAEVIVEWHPAYLLRLSGRSKQTAIEGFVDTLRTIAELLEEARE